MHWANLALPCRLNGARTACGNCPGTRPSEGAGLAPYENGQILYLTRRRSPGLGGYLSHIVHEPDQMSVPLLVANAIIPFWKTLGVRNEKNCDSQSDSVAFRFYTHF